MGERTELCAVVKANGYGHGAAPCAAAAMRGGATVLAVAAAAEAEELRLHFPDARLFVMGALTEEEVRVALTARAEIAVWRDGFRELCSRMAPEFRDRARVHVKHDSGMGRLGERDPEALIEIARTVSSDDNLELAGVWTHFATADEPGDAYLGEQLAAFAPVADAVREIAPDAPSTRRTARPRFETRRRTSTWSAAASRSTGSTCSTAIRPITGSSPRWRSIPTSPT